MGRSGEAGVSGQLPCSQAAGRVLGSEESIMAGPHWTPYFFEPRFLVKEGIDQLISVRTIQSLHFVILEFTCPLINSCLLLNPSMQRQVSNGIWGVY